MSRRVLVAVVVFVGFFVGFGSGLIEQPGLGVPEERYYGFPLVWRMVNTATGDKFTYPLELFIDVVFGVVIVSIIAVSTVMTYNWMNRRHQQIVK